MKYEPINIFEMGCVKHDPMACGYIIPAPIEETRAVYIGWKFNWKGLIAWASALASIPCFPMLIFVILKAMATAWGEDNLEFTAIALAFFCTQLWRLLFMLAIEAGPIVEKLYDYIKVDK